jgi:hypothetical protein
MRLIRLFLYLVLIAVMVGLLYVFLTGGLPHRVADGVIVPAPSTQPGPAPMQSMEGDIRAQQEVVREFLDSIPSPGTAAP